MYLCMSPVVLTMVNVTVYSGWDWIEAVSFPSEGAIVPQVEFVGYKAPQSALQIELQIYERSQFSTTVIGRKESELNH